MTEQALDPLTGLPVDLQDTNFGQIPLDSQPINLDDLAAIGKQSNWLYPDNIIPTVSRLQARNILSQQNAQDLSTDGDYNLRVAMAAGGNSGGTFPFPPPNYSEAAVYGGDSNNPDDLVLAHVPHILYTLRVEFAVWKTLTSGSEATAYLYDTANPGGNALFCAGVVWFPTGSAKGSAVAVRTVDFQSASGLDLRSLLAGVTSVALTFNCSPSISASYALTAHTYELP